MNQWKSAYAAKTKARTLAEALEGADAFFGLSAKGAVTPEMVQSMAEKPIIFAMANPDPEITPEEVHAVRDDAIVATGRSDYPNQVNNVLGFPFIFRGALDVQASTINDDDEDRGRPRAGRPRPRRGARSGDGRLPRPAPDVRPRLHHPRAVRSAPHQPRAAGRRQGGDGYRRRPPAARRHGRLHRTPQGPARSRASAGCSRRSTRCAAEPQARHLLPKARSRPSSAPPTPISQEGFGTPMLVGTATTVRKQLQGARRQAAPRVRDLSTRASRPTPRSSPTFSMPACSGAAICSRDCQRLVAQRAQHLRGADGRARLRRRHGLGRHAQLDQRVRGRAPRHRSQARPQRHRRLARALPRPRRARRRHQRARHADARDELANIAIEAAPRARKFGMEPRVALLAYSTFGQPRGERSDDVRKAVEMLRRARRRLRVRRRHGGRRGAQPRSAQALSVLPPDRHGQRADHAGVPRRVDLDQDAAASWAAPRSWGRCWSASSTRCRSATLGAKDSDIVNLAALAAYQLGKLRLAMAAKILSPSVR